MNKENASKLCKIIQDFLYYLIMKKLLEIVVLDYIIIK